MLKTDWEDSFGSCLATNLFAQALAWQEADIDADPAHDGDLVRALGFLTAQVREWLAT